MLSRMKEYSSRGCQNGQRLWALPGRRWKRGRDKWNLGGGGLERKLGLDRAVDFGREKGLGSTRLSNQRGEKWRQEGVVKSIGAYYKTEKVLSGARKPTWRKN